jgi:hypothetical protein
MIDSPEAASLKPRAPFFFNSIQAVGYRLTIGLNRRFLPRLVWQGKVYLVGNPFN